MSRGAAACATGLLVVAVAVGLGLGLGGAAAVAAGPQPAPWDGVNPFRCELQNAGTGASVPHPEADPFCIEYDKRHQNIDQLGMVDFLSKEPARTALAVPKCFYFQSDHWRSSVVQSNGSTEIYQWDGHYFFNKATGEGGAWVTNFNINGHSGDPTALPGFPPQWGPDFGPGTGGFILNNSVQTDPSCVMQAHSNPATTYAAPTPSGQPAALGTAPSFACAQAIGGVGASHIGPIELGNSAQRVRQALGPPAKVRAGFLHYCEQGAGKYLVGFSPAVRLARATGVVMLLTTNAGYQMNGVGRAAEAGVFHGRFPDARFLLRQGRTRVWALGAGSPVIAGLRKGRVRYLAVYDRRAIPTRAQLRRTLRRAGR
jgi:hypothetical protein